MIRKPLISMQRRFLTFGIAVILILATAWWGICGITGPPPKNPGVLPPHSHAFGTTYGELAGEWWNWAMQFPIDTNPVLDTSGEFCDLGQQGKIWFLAGTFGGTAVRECTVPTGKALFFPLINGNSFVPDFGDTEDEVRADARNDVDRTISLECTIDDEPLQDLFSYRAESPEGGYTFSIPEGSILTVFDFEPGYRYPAVADGYWILLAPLSKGEHVVEFGGIVEDAEGEFNEIEAIYHLTVGDEN